MGVRVNAGDSWSERYFPDARDWYVSDEGVLQVYQHHGNDPEFVIAEFNRNSWSMVEYDPPIQEGENDE